MVWTAYRRPVKRRRAAEGGKQVQLLVVHEKQARGPGVKWNAFEKVGEEALRTLGWPRGWAKPDDTLLRELGWDWEQVKAKEGPPN